MDSPTYGSADMLHGTASIVTVVTNNTGGARGRMGYIFASPVAPVECRITARNDAYFGDSPKDLAIQWCTDEMHWHPTDSLAGLTWTSSQTSMFSITP